MKVSVNELLATPVAMLLVGLIWFGLIKPSDLSKAWRFILGLLLIVAGVLLMLMIRFSR